MEIGTIQDAYEDEMEKIYGQLEEVDNPLILVKLLKISSQIFLCFIENI